MENFEQEVLNEVNSSFPGWDWPLRQKMATQIIQWVNNIRKFMLDHPKMTDIVMNSLGYKRNE